MINPKIIKLIYAYITQSYGLRIKHKHDDKNVKCTQDHAILRNTERIKQKIKYTIFKINLQTLEVCIL